MGHLQFPQEIITEEDKRLKNAETSKRRHVVPGIFKE
jgi:hypothetical protein